MEKTCDNCHLSFLCKYKADFIRNCPDWVSKEKGQWLENGYGVFCSVCGAEADNELGSFGRIYRVKPFCGHCGTRMERENEK